MTQIVSKFNVIHFICYTVLENKFEVIKMETNQHVCLNCGYYRRHYIWSFEFRPVDYGHCVHPPRIRHCRPEDACPKWIPQDEIYRNRYIP